MQIKQAYGIALGDLTLGLRSKAFLLCQVNGKYQMDFVWSDRGSLIDNPTCCWWPPGVAPLMKVEGRWALHDSYASAPRCQHIAIQWAYYTSAPDRLRRRARRGQQSSCTATLLEHQSCDSAKDDWRRLCQRHDEGEPKVETMLALLLDGARGHHRHRAILPSHQIESACCL